MDLQEKLDNIEEQILRMGNDLRATKLTLKTLNKAKKEYLKLIEKAKTLEQK